MSHILSTLPHFTLLCVVAIAVETYKPGILRYFFWSALVELFALAFGRG